MISAIILAAGQSKRMGQSKQLLGAGGKTLLQSVLDSALQTDVDEVILVLGYEAEKILRKTVTRGAKVVINPDYARGMITSIRKGLETLDQKSEAFFIVLGDQPEIGPDIYNRLIREFRRAYPSKSILLPTHCGKRGHPALFSTKYLAEGFSIKGDTGFREIVQKHPDEVLFIEVDAASILMDIDTPEDYQEYLQRNQRENDFDPK